MSSPPAVSIPLPASPPPAEEPEAASSISARLDASETATDSPAPPAEHEPATEPEPTPAPDVIIQQPSPVPDSTPAPKPRSPPPSSQTPNPDLPPQPTTPSTAPPPTPPSKPRGAEALRRDSVITMGSGAFSPGQSTVSLASMPSGNGGPHRRSLTISRSSLGGGQTSHVSAVLITSALDTIASSREAKRSPALKTAVDKALELIKAGEAGSRVREVFEPLRLACESKAEKLQVPSLDCIAKLIAYGFFVEDSYFSSHPQGVTSPPASPAPGQSAHARNGSDGEGAGSGGALVDIVVGTITACHTENCSDAVSLQVVKALLALVLSPTTLVHQSSLLKAVRTVYNVFLTSTDPVNQTVAQGGLTQMINHVFARCSVSTAPGATSSNSNATTPPSESSPPTPAQVLEQARQRVNGDSRDNGDGALDTPIGENAPLAPSPVPATNGNGYANGDAQGSEAGDEGVDGEGARHQLTTNDLFLKDAFLVCRAMCKLTMKPLTTEAERDLRNHATRTKLLSLHMVLAILQQHMHVFVAPDAVVWSGSGHAPASFIDMTSQYLCLTLSRNMTSPVPQVFELSIEIFWQMVQGLRTKLKQEIGVLFHEIFLPVLELRTATVRQKAILLGMVRRLCADPQVIVDLYINYDCDSNAPDNIYEHLMNIITKLSGSVGGSSTSDSTKNKEKEPVTPQSPPTKKSQLPPSLTTGALGLPEVPGSGASTEAQLRRQALETLVAVLRSLVAWGITQPKEREKAEAEREREAAARLVASASTDRLAGTSTPDRQSTSTPDLGAGDDDPSRFESAKQKKTTLAEGIRRFSLKPKKALDFFRQNGFLEGSEPEVVAKFLLSTEGLSKAAIGEYLGEGEPENIATMHAFVDLIDMRNLTFIAALRNFLQAFRLPGEAQKIDRFMLKFAERYIESNSNNTFANADAAYVLSYSVILLNTDAHNPQIKKRMTKEEFIRNNRGINDNADLPQDMLSDIYDEITTNEIRMKGELEASLMKDPGAAAAAAAPGGLAGSLATVGRDLQREAYILQSSNMANKTEALFKTMVRAQRRAGSTANGEVFHRASHFVHVRPMFEAVWLSLLAALSGPLHETDQLDVVELCLEGFKCAIRIACFFDMELERNAFVTTLAKFTFLNNLGEMRSKNMEAIKALLDVAVSEGNNLKGSWHEVLSCVSQLEHMQLITSGVNVPDARKGRTKAMPNEALAHESRSTHITVAADMVFSLSHHLSGTAIVDFVQALCDVSWEEIQSSGLSQHPRLFSLQKLVEISYYNMSRIRLEWSNLWDILGEHFNQVCCHSNPHVGFFALDSLRQLAMRFLEKEELPHFKFQKDFLKPFEYTMNHNQNPEIRDMVLQCLQQMVQARVQNMRSGWRTMFGVFSAASRVPTERIAGSAFEIVTRLHKEHFTAIVRYGAFADLTVCVTDFCKVSKYQKISLLAIAMLRGTIPTMLATPECGLAASGGTAAGTGADDPMIRFWFPVLFSFYDVIMNGEDLEVRRLALDSLFSTLKRYGAAFPVEFWDTVTQELLFPIFAVLRSSQDLSRFNTQEDMSVWLSTTMIQALRDLIDLYTFYFDILERFLDGLLDLLCVCICQENDTLARIGTSCLQQLLENNVKKLSPARWDRVASTFVKLFKTTTPHQLFDDSLRVEINSASPEPQDPSEGSDSTILPAPLSPSQEGAPVGKPSLHERRRIFKQIIVKCVLQLLLIETTNELLRNEDVYATIPPQNLLQLMQVLDHSYQFARMFNGDKELRTGLWRVGFMKHLPNLLKQESSSAATLVHVLSRMYFDPRPEHQAARPQVAERLLPLGLRVLQDYNALRSDTQAKNIAAWTPVVAEIVRGFVRLDDRAYNRYLPAIYPVAAELLARETSLEVRESLRDYFLRVGYAQGIVERPA